ncbi:MAG: hypothetical protein RBT69_10025 [Spirochaetia bacterium]|jgi:hypothetical protein|nr:hypothetical protein [Spirochaetia bacterium]
MLEVDKNDSELENYGVWVKSGPDNYTDDKNISASDDFELTDLDSSSDNFLLTEEEERLLDSLEEDVKNGEETEDLFNVQEIDDLDFEDEYAEPDSDNLLDDEEEFIDIEIPQSIESKEALKSSPKTESFYDEQENKSFEMISRIATDLKNDLSSIKNELHELKLELAKYKKLEAREAEVSEENGKTEEDESASGGFFSDDGDETIALTGDELDNIFNTAEITEETPVFEEGEKLEAEAEAEISESSPEVSEEAIKIDIPSEDLFEDKDAETSQSEASEYEENRDELDFLDGKPEEIISEASDSSEEITEEDIINTEKDLKVKNDYHLPEEENIEKDAASLPEQETAFDDENEFEMSLDDELTLDIPESEDEEISLDSIQEEIALEEDFTAEEDAIEEPSEEEEELTLGNDFTSEEAIEEAADEEVELTLGDDFTSEEAIEEAAEEEEELTLGDDFTSEEAIEEAAEEEEEITLDNDFTLYDNKETTLDEGSVFEEIPESEDFQIEDISIDEEISLEDEITIDEDLSNETADNKKTAAEKEKSIPEINEEIDFDTTFEKPDVKIGSQPQAEPASDNDVSIDLDDADNIADILTDEESQPADDIFTDIPEEEEETIDVQEQDEQNEQEIVSDKKNLDDIPENLKIEIKSVLVYLDQLLEALPEGKIEEFAKSEHFRTYKKLFQELGLM